MSNRIPPSLKWLLNKRARLLGEILKAEKELKEIVELKEKNLSVLRDDLTTIDNTIRLHDIPVEPTLIRPIRGQTTGRMFAHGDLTNAILACVTQAHPYPISTNDIAIVVAEDLDISPQSEDFAVLRSSIRYRLKNMCVDRWVTRVHGARTNQIGRWHLGEKALLYFQQVRK